MLVEVKGLTTLLSVIAALVVIPTAIAASATLFGGATRQGHAVELVSNLSDASPANDFSGIDFKNTGVTTFASLTRLDTMFNAIHNSCGGGSPRFQINIDGKNVFVYLGPSPTFTGCLPNAWTSSGNLIGNNDPCRWDTSQLAPGTQCNTYTGALALLGSHAVTGFQLVVDSGWFFPTDQTQTFLVCGIHINQNTFFRCGGNGQGNDDDQGDDDQGEHEGGND